MRVTGRLRSDDEGAVLITVGIFLLAIMVFAAWAVDISAVLVERRSAQNTADVAALSGIQMTAGLSQPAAIAAAEAEVRRISNVNHGIADSEWPGCTDPAQPSTEFPIASSNPCVWFAPGLAEIRVRLPDQSVDTVFAGVIGINSINTRAGADAGYYLSDGNGLLPFGLPPTASGAVCLKTGSQDLSPPCDIANTNGNFGFLEFKLYQSLAPNACAAGTNPLEENIAVGVDHPLSKKTLTNTLISELSVCGNIGGRPNAAREQTGSSDNLDGGMVSNPDARLKGGPNTKTSVYGHFLDDRPLWTYLIGGTGICDEANIAAAPIPHEAMADCLYHPNPPGSPTFELSLIQSPRWSWVPRIHQDFTFGNPLYEFTDFEPVFIQTVYYQCSPICPEFNPGELGIYGGSKKAHAASALLIPGSFLTGGFPLGPGAEETIEITLNK